MSGEFLQRGLIVSYTLSGKALMAERRGLVKMFVMATEGTTLRVIIADDSDLVRERMVSLLREIPRVEVVAETADVPGTITCVRSLLPHVIILDISMPGGCGLDVLDMVRAEHIPSMVLVLTNFSDREYESRACRDGAVAFLDKSRDFLKAVDYVSELVGRLFPLHAGAVLPFARTQSGKMGAPNDAADQNEFDETLDLVRSIRDTIREFKSRAERQNASIRASHSNGFIFPMPVADASQDANPQVCGHPYTDPHVVG